MGMNHAREIYYVTRLAEPDVALIINAGTAHLEYFGSMEAIARAKGEIFDGLKENGIAIFNADDDFAPLWRKLAAQKRQVEFGIRIPTTVNADYRLRHFDSEIFINAPHAKIAAIVAAPGLHNVRNALAAAAVASTLEIPPSAISAGLAHFHSNKGRLQYKRGINAAAIIDDSYNANPDSVRAAIDVLAALPGKRILILGDMGELGVEAAALHAAMGAYAHKAQLNGLFTIGDLSTYAAHEFGSSAQSFAKVDDLVAAITPLLEPQTTFLVKGSRFMRMERVADALIDEVTESTHVA
jgi:UDP-N-acetylmuramoyl-tripeptide--D-alanyl-D-alanine ligase